MKPCTNCNKYTEAEGGICAQCKPKSDSRASVKTSLGSMRVVATYEMKDAFLRKCYQETGKPPTPQMLLEFVLDLAGVAAEEVKSVEEQRLESTDSTIYYITLKEPKHE